MDVWTISCCTVKWVTSSAWIGKWSFDREMLTGYEMIGFVMKYGFNENLRFLRSLCCHADEINVWWEDSENHLKLWHARMSKHTRPINKCQEFSGSSPEQSAGRTLWDKRICTGMRLSGCGQLLHDEVFLVHFLCILLAHESAKNTSSL